MAAKKDDKTGHGFIGRGTLSPLDEAMISSIFDQGTDMDEMDILQNMQQEAILRKVALVKLLISPFEILATRIIAGKNFSLIVKAESRIYFRFLRRKMSLDEFKTEMLNLAGVYE